MYVCIGGDLDGKIVERYGPHLKASVVEKDKSSKYYKQRYIFEGNEYLFWIVYGLNFDETVQRVGDILGSNKA